MENLQYITDIKGKPIAVVLPIKFWNSVLNDETNYLLRSNKMKKRIKEALNRDGGLTMELVHENLGV